MDPQETTQECSACGANVPKWLGDRVHDCPSCGLSIDRDLNVLAILRDEGVEPQVIEYLKDPPTREKLKELIKKMGVKPRDVLRQKGTPYDELGLGDPALTDDELIDAMMKHPILINRPIVVTPKGVKLCRPSETVRELL